MKRCLSDADPAAVKRTKTRHDNEYCIFSITNFIAVFQVTCNFPDRWLSLGPDTATGQSRLDSLVG